MEHRKNIENVSAGMCVCVSVCACVCECECECMSVCVSMLIENSNDMNLLVNTKHIEQSIITLCSCSHRGR